MPNPVPSAYSGFSLKLSDQVVPSGGSATANWMTDLKAKTGMEATLDIDGDGSEPTLKLKDNTISYLTSWEGGAAAPSDKIIQAGVGKTYGRLGQGAKIGALATAPKPFAW